MAAFTHLCTIDAVFARDDAQETFDAERSKALLNKGLPSRTFKVYASVDGSHFLYRSQNE